MFVKNKFILNLIIITTIAVVFCYYFVDIPVIEFTYYHNLQQYKFLDYCSRLIELIELLIPVIIVFLILKGIYYCRLNLFSFTLLLSCVSTLFVIALKMQLKFIFARYWGVTWINHNLSWIHDHAYGFQWFKSGVMYASFPSGHTAAMATFCGVWWVLWPASRIFVSILCSIEIMGLIGMSYHFISDIIAGLSLGIMTSYYICHFCLKESMINQR